MMLGSVYDARKCKRCLEVYNKVYGDWKCTAKHDDWKCTAKCMMIGSVQQSI